MNGTPRGGLLRNWQTRRGQAGFTLVELLVVIAMKTDGATIQNAVDLYFYNKSLYPDTPADVALPPGPANGDTVNIGRLLTSNLLHQAPPATEAFTYVVKAGYGAGTVQGNLVPASAGCRYNP